MLDQHPRNGLLPEQLIILRLRLCDEYHRPLFASHTPHVMQVRSLLRHPSVYLDPIYVNEPNFSQVETCRGHAGILNSSLIDILTFAAF